MDIDMIIFRPFKAGDFIEAAGVKGTVDENGIAISYPQRDVHIKNKTH